MRQTDIVIVGAGLAGSAAAAMLGRTDHAVEMVDPHRIYPPDFRCEKLDPTQFRLLRRIGLAGAVSPVATRCDELWVARFGRLVDRMPLALHGILYQDLVNAVRAAVPGRVAFTCAKVKEIATGDDRQTILLSNGDQVSARLVILANGLNWSLRRSLGVACETLSADHSTSIGFDMAPPARTSFPFDALTYYGEDPAERVAYLSLFRIGTAMRANLFVYRDVADPWVRQFRTAPTDALRAALPGLARMLGAVEVASPAIARPADLYAAGNVRQPGFVLIGDAFATSCPAAGTGTGKVLTDVERLCAVYIPEWFRTDGMGAEKTAAFYDDPVKARSDLDSRLAAFHLRALSTEPGALWRARRAARFWGRLGKGVARRAAGLPRTLLSRPERAPASPGASPRSGGAPG